MPNAKYSKVVSLSMIMLVAAFGFFIFTASPAKAAVCEYIAASGSGEFVFSNASKWKNCNGQVPGVNDMAVIGYGQSVLLQSPASLQNNGKLGANIEVLVGGLTIKDGATLYYPDPTVNSVTYQGNSTVSGIRAPQNLKVQGKFLLDNGTLDLSAADQWTNQLSSGGVAIWFKGDVVSQGSLSVFKLPTNLPTHFYGDVAFIGNTTPAFLGQSEMRGSKDQVISSSLTPMKAAWFKLANPSRQGAVTVYGNLDVNNTLELLGGVSYKDKLVLPGSTKVSATNLTNSGSITLKDSAYLSAYHYAVNSGAIQVNKNAAFSVLNGLFDQKKDGKLTSQGTLTFQGDFSVAAGSVVNATDGVAVFTRVGSYPLKMTTPGSVNFNDVQVTAGKNGMPGQVVVVSPQKLYVNGDLMIDGPMTETSLTVQGGASLVVKGNVTNPGQLMTKDKGKVLAAGRIFNDGLLTVDTATGGSIVHSADVAITDKNGSKISFLTSPSKVYVTVHDDNRNLDGTKRDMIQVMVVVEDVGASAAPKSAPKSGSTKPLATVSNPELKAYDKETIGLMETDVNSGIFRNDQPLSMSYVGAPSMPSLQNGWLEIRNNAWGSAIYKDDYDATDKVNSAKVTFKMGADRLKLIPKPTTTSTPTETFQLKAPAPQTSSEVKGIKLFSPSLCQIITDKKMCIGTSNCGWSTVETNTGTVESCADHQWPSKPTAKGPTQTDQVTSLTPTLSWSWLSMTDLGLNDIFGLGQLMKLSGNAPSYRWYVEDVDTGKRVWERGWISGDTVDSNCLDQANHWICQQATVPPGKLEYDKPYRWAVEVNNGGFGSGYNTTQDFRVTYAFKPERILGILPESSPSTPGFVCPPGFECFGF